ncbi:MAG: TetR/AcrR family transcriptional regulator [Lachnospiraceae bacterium]|nr:TetR/AcrR family transcriptional regulator [Lachnospiraceae bacterium]
MKKDITKKAFVDALLKVIEKKRLGDIRIDDICSACGLSKKTFYYHFKDKYDLATYAYDYLETENLEEFLGEGKSFLEETKKGNTVLNKVGNESVDMLIRMSELWYRKYPPQVGVNLLFSSKDSNCPDMLRHKAEMEGRKVLLRDRLEKSYRVMKPEIMELAASSLCHLAEFYYQRWGLGTKEEEFFELVFYSNRLLDFWVEQGEEILK